MRQNINSHYQRGRAGDKELSELLINMLALGLDKRIIND